MSNRTASRAAMLSVLGAAASMVFSHAAPAEIFRVADMVRGIEVSQAQCARTPNAVWVTVGETSVCMRYYISTVGGHGPNPVVFMQGDQFGRYDRQTKIFEGAASANDVDSRDLQRVADAFSKATGTTGIYLARVGVDGSSGFHGIRDSLLEVNLTNAALDAIKQRHQFIGFNLAGQSGGSTNIGGLLALRTDILCAVSGSGRLAPDGKNHSAPLDRISPIDYVQTIAQRSRARILVLTDPTDTKVPAAQQTPFVEALLRVGGKVEQFPVRATDENHHGVMSYTYPAMAGCMHGATTQQIALSLQSTAQRIAMNSR
jgi:hypothetical protein